MSVGGRVIEIAHHKLEDGMPVMRLWVVDRDGTETCVYSHQAPPEGLPHIGEEVWWQAGRIYFDRDRRHLTKVGYSFAAPGTR